MASEPYLILTPRNSDAATLAAGSQIGSLPVGNMQTIQPKKVWRSNMTTTDYVTVALASAIACTDLVLVGHNFSAGATIRVRGAATAGAVTSSPVVDTAAVSAWPTSGMPTVPDWPNWFSLVRWSNATPLQYWRIDIVDTGNPDGYLEVGRLALGACWQPTINFDLGGTPYGFNTVDVQVTTPWGYTFTDRRTVSPARMVQLTVTAHDKREVMDGLAEIQRLAGQWGDVMLVLDPSATTDFHRFAMQAVWSKPPSFPLPQAFNENGVMFGASLQALELL